ncbi:hypothetical protein HYH03_009845 [Edaphochlamys debaryana]|uniref:Uncharacterized protein n=1 Tax=Edaphochlamys debaryana TaxID=47281 RepID=A0A836BY40_9CHLO|nr:hypothetical protein HYH03_009845 [Edaphochlamys debaryana]|eukprot:KAG2491893.1 hypothetical protein HYH03_009845 [Edaphochlamys debaryana]
MPRLADYVRAQRQPRAPPTQPQQQEEQQQQQPERQGQEAAAASAVQGLEGPPPTDEAGRAASRAPTAPAAPLPPAAAAPPRGPVAAALQAAHDRHVRMYERRLRDRGPRAYRHADGSLRPEPPRPEPYAQAHRVHWKELVDHCRTHGGDLEYDTHGFSLRYGVGVPEEEHRRLLQKLELHAELSPQPPAAADDHDGDPLADPSHPFNREWRPLVQAVFDAAPHPWWRPAA